MMPVRWVTVKVAAVAVANRDPAVRYGPYGSGRAGPRIVGCSPDKPMLLIVA